MFNLFSDVFPVGMELVVINVTDFHIPVSLIYWVNFFRVAICSPSCVNGNCTWPDVCNCSTGWKDSICSTRIFV